MLSIVHIDVAYVNDSVSWMHSCPCHVLMATHTQGRVREKLGYMILTIAVAHVK